MVANIEKNLTALEQAISSEIIAANAQKYPFLKEHLPLLVVKSREFTGVGVYVNFDYEQDVSLLRENSSDNQKAILLSSDKSLTLDSLKFDLTYVLTLSNGRFENLELVTNGREGWDGKYKSFEFSDG